MAPGTFCATHEKHLFERRNPHHAQTAQHGAHQHAERNEYMLIGPKTIHERPKTSAQWARQCMVQCTVDPQRRCEISVQPKKGGPFGLTIIASAAVHIVACRF